MSESATKKRYYVSGYTENATQDDHFRPICVTKMGVATERHIYNDSETFDVPNGTFYVDVFPDLKTAWSICKERASLSTIVIDDNVPDEDRQFISDDINAHPELMNYRFSGSGSSCYNRRMAYIRHHEMESMCRANRINADFKLAGSTALSDKYSDLLTKNDSDSKNREDIFEKQAAYQRAMGLRFSTDVISSVIDSGITDAEAEKRMDSFYKDVADIYKMPYVSTDDIEIQSVEELDDGLAQAVVLYNCDSYDVVFDAKKRASRDRQAADAVLQRVREMLAIQDDTVKGRDEVVEPDIEPDGPSVDVVETDAAVDRSTVEDEPATAREIIEIPDVSPVDDGFSL